MGIVKESKLLVSHLMEIHNYYTKQLQSGSMCTRENNLNVETAND